MTNFNEAINMFKQGELKVAARKTSGVYSEIIQDIQEILKEFSGGLTPAELTAIYNTAKKTTFKSKKFCDLCWTHSTASKSKNPIFKSEGGKYMLNK